MITRRIVQTTAESVFPFSWMHPVQPFTAKPEKITLDAVPRAHFSLRTLPIIVIFSQSQHVAVIFTRIPLNRWFVLPEALRCLRYFSLLRAVLVILLRFQGRKEQADCPCQEAGGGPVPACRPGSRRSHTLQGFAGNTQGRR